MRIGAMSRDFDLTPPPPSPVFIGLNHEVTHFF